MALFERFCAHCNEIHDPDSSYSFTTKQNIVPGTSLFVKKAKTVSPVVTGAKFGEVGVPAQKFPKKTNKALAGRFKPKSKVNPKRPKKVDAKPEVIPDTAQWELANVRSRCGNLVTVSLPSKRLQVIDLDKEDTCLPTNHETREDMTELHYGHEAAILHNLKLRALDKKPYTFIGNVLVSINPLQNVPDDEIDPIEDNLPPHPKSIAERAYQKMSFAGAQQRRLVDYDNRGERDTKFAPTKGSLVNKDSKFATTYGLVNQSVLVSGESGSGKTEASRRVLAHLVQREGSSEESYDDGPEAFEFQDMLIGSDPVLESFGNAQTVRNPNSSRFGKFLELKYQPVEDDEHEVYYLYGAKITTYLLERSRVTYQDSGEKNYKIFYQLLTANHRRMQEILGFEKAGHKFNYLGRKFERRDHDRIGYITMRTGIRMSKLGVRSLRLFQVVAAVLHIGNIEFVESNSKEGPVAAIEDEFRGQYIKKKSRNLRGNNKKRLPSIATGKTGSYSQGRKSSVRTRNFMSRGRSFLSTSRNTRNRLTKGSVNSVGTTFSGSAKSLVSRRTNIVIPNDENRTRLKYSPLTVASELLQVDPNMLEKMLLETVVNLPGGERIEKRVSVAKAEQRREAIAKHIYALLFEWIVTRLNENLSGEPDPQNADYVSSIGILDVFGFEEFRKNGFEQLLINYANEVLLSLFVREILIGESEIYKAEGLVLQAGDLERIEEVTQSYQSCLTLFEGEGGKKKAPGFFSTIDSQGKVPKPSDEKLLSTLQRNFAKHDCFLPVHPSKKNSAFIIKHYASEVTYQIENFLQKNDQSLPADIEMLFKSSKHGIIRNFPFLSMGSGASKKVKNGRKTKLRKTQAGKKALPSKIARPARKAKNSTVCSTFTKQMDALKKTLERTGCSYIRCVKPNAALTRPTSSVKVVNEGRNQKIGEYTSKRFMSVKLARERQLSTLAPKRVVQKYFDDNYVSNQLKNLGVFECVNVLKAGLPQRVPYPSFMQTYANSIPLDEIPFYRNRPIEFRNKMYVASLMNIFAIDPSFYKLGFTRIFFQNGQLDKITGVLALGILPPGRKGRSRKLKLMRKFNAFYCRKLFRVAFAKIRAIQYFIRDLKRFRASRLIQKIARSFLEYKRFTHENRVRRSAVSIQTLWRGYSARKKYEEMKTDRMQAQLTNFVTDFEVDGLSNFGSQAPRSRVDAGPTDWETNTEFVEHEDSMDDSKVDNAEFMSTFSSVGYENNALRGTLQNYLNRRTTYNRKTNALSRVYNDKRKREFSRRSVNAPGGSVYSNGVSDDDWENIEFTMYEFDGVDADPELDPMSSAGEEDDDGYSPSADGNSEDEVASQSRYSLRYDSEQYDREYDEEYSDEEGDGDRESELAGNASLMPAGESRPSKERLESHHFGDDVLSEDEIQKDDVLSYYQKEMKKSNIIRSRNTRNTRNTRSTRATRPSRHPSQYTKRTSNPVLDPDDLLSDTSARENSMTGDPLKKSRSVDQAADAIFKQTASSNNKTRAKVLHTKVKPKGVRFDEVEKVPTYNNQVKGKVVNRLNPTLFDRFEKKPQAPKQQPWGQVRLRKVEKIKKKTQLAVVNDDSNNGFGAIFGTKLKRTNRNLKD